MPQMQAPAAQVTKLTKILCARVVISADIFFYQVSVIFVKDVLSRLHYFFLARLLSSSLSFLHACWLLFLFLFLSSLHCVLF